MSLSLYTSAITPKQKHPKAPQFTLNESKPNKKVLIHKMDMNPTNN